MCGICGYIRNKLIDGSILNSMNDTMYHRGPNDYGIWELQQTEYAIGFAQRRLSILDLSQLGHQPMVSKDSNLVITYNGEVYNFLSIRKELEELGYSFYSNCDTEVILASYKEWGTDCFPKFIGMFSIAIFDKNSDRLILARDRIGKKPLYYYHKDDEFVFASELKPIMHYPGFIKEIDRDSIAIYLCNKCIRSPKTIFAYTYKLEPGTFMIYDCRKGIIQEKTAYWDLISIFNNSKKRLFELEDAKAELRELLKDSINMRLISDVPVGTFLSGGIDSTLITALSQDVKSSSIDSFTIGFDDKERNEAPFARKIARHIGTNHHELYMSERETFDQLYELVKYYDEPFSDASQLPCMLVSKMASRDVTVALSGDGGDEICCGYSMYDYNRLVQRLDWIGNLECRMPWNKRIIKTLPPYVRAFINNRDTAFKTQLFSDMFKEEVDSILIDETTKIKSNKELLIISNNHQEKRMILDMVDYLPNDILTKMDRASMKYSLEVRCPLLDHRIIEWSFGVDHNLKYHRGDKKYLLKQLAYDYVPKELLDNPKKGFGVPLVRWLRTTLKPEIQRVTEKDIIERQAIFKYEGIKQLVEKQRKSNSRVYAHVLWGFYVFQMWYNEYIEEIL